MLTVFILSMNCFFFFFTFPQSSFLNLNLIKGVTLFAQFITLRVSCRGTQFLEGNVMEFRGLSWSCGNLLAYLSLFFLWCLLISHDSFTSYFFLFTSILIFQVRDALQYMVWRMQFYDCQGCKVQCREEASGELLFYKGNYTLECR